MTDNDDQELRRLCSALERLEMLTKPDSMEREALRKAGFALGLSFINGDRQKLERLYEIPTLNDEELDRRCSYGIEPEYCMPKPEFKIGQLIRVVSLPRLEQMPQETKDIFSKCVGQLLRVDGFGRYGHLELNVLDDGSQAPNYCHHTIWIEAEHVEATL